MELLHASTSDALTITGISRRAFHSDVEVGSKEKLNIGRIFIGPEDHRKGYGVFMMQAIEALFPSVKEFTLDTPIWNSRTNSFYMKLGYTEVRRDNDFVYFSKMRYNLK